MFPLLSKAVLYHNLKGPTVLLQEVGLPCDTEFLHVLFFAIFSVVRKNKFPQIKITANIFPANIFSRVNIFFLT